MSGKGSPKIRTQLKLIPLANFQAVGLFFEMGGGTPAPAHALDCFFFFETMAKGFLTVFPISRGPKGRLNLESSPVLLCYPRKVPMKKQ